MHIYAIGDLHFSGVPESKPMDVFGEHWKGHRPRIIENWKQTVTPEDTVILCGDISWAIKLPDVVKDDLREIAALPGKKVMLRGNHDYWWTGLSKMKKATGDAFFFLQNNFCAIEDEGMKIAVCGSRGWLTPVCEGYKPETDDAIFRHEELRIRASLDAARQAGFTEIILALHYPPFYSMEEDSIFKQLIDEYGVKTCVFGHIHGAEGAAAIFEGQRDGCTYKLVSCDTQGFTPVRIR
ncbi:MAG: metallophosphoesterase [Acidaminococcaceae bacterium]|nr:metallophosphoesterase [Acidaminococcaceae bacterium]